MARTKKTTKAKGNVSVNFSGVQSRQLLPEDDYRLKLSGATQGESSSGNDQIEWVFKVNDGSKYNGQQLWLYTPLTENSLWKLHALLTAFGIDVPDDELDIDLEQMVEDELEIMGVVGHETYDGAKRSKLQDFYAVEEGSEAPSKDDKKSGGKKKAAAGVTREAVEAMDRDELEELITEHDLDVDADDKAYKKDAKLLEAVLEELEEKELLIEEEEAPKGKKKAEEADEDETPAQARKRRREARKAKDEEEEAPKSKRGAKDEEEDEPKGKKAAGKGKKLPKLTTDEVQGMDEDELAEVIEKYDLDTDLDDYKTLRKKAAAVIDALEDGEHIEDE